MNNMTLGFTVPMARFYGGKQVDKLKKAFATSVSIGVVLCLVFVVLMQAFMDELILFMNIEEHLRADAKTYCTVLVSGLFFTFAYNLGASVLRALGNSVTPLLLLICSSVLNVVLDLVFIINFNNDI